MSGHDVLPLWEAFFIIVGSSAGALTGLQFVVMALVNESSAPKDPSLIDTFGTPTVVHFCAVLLVSAVLSAPWPHLLGAAITTGITGAAGTVYSIIVVRRARSGLSYKPEMEDWIWHCALPLIGYATLLVSSIALPSYHVPALFGVGVFSLLLLFIGIHNAWDTVTYVTVRMNPPAPSAKASPNALPED
ncbi:MAG TPA: hypothetical protein VK544_09545 [Gemmatimonadaceae bacterium]|jgi:hypothetical protein|nr:hypothetical protein [Gemmatimonadaceae bacterium]